MQNDGKLWENDGNMMEHDGKHMEKMMYNMMEHDDFTFPCFSKPFKAST